MTLSVNLKATVPGAGEVAIVGTIEEVALDIDPLAAMQAWLENIDAGELERAALESMQLGSQSFTAEVLGVLRRWAGGNP